jgi:hypothetical protein
VFSVKGAASFRNKSWLFFVIALKTALVEGLVEALVEGLVKGVRFVDGPESTLGPPRRQAAALQIYPKG